MIFNRPRAKKQPDGLTWYFNETLNISKNISYSARFTCNAISDKLTGIQLLSLAKAMAYKKSDGAYPVYRTNDWINQAYRTITFEEEPTGDLLAFLEANATPQ